MTTTSLSQAFTLTSQNFEHNTKIPLQFSWKSGNKPPELNWQNAPEGTKSFVLICDDPDAPKKNWTHWLIFNIPAHFTSLPSDIGRNAETAHGIRQGINDFNELGYDGPYPPEGKPHRYIFTLYALDTLLTLPPGIGKDELIKAMQGHVLKKTELIGLYQR